MKRENTPEKSPFELPGCAEQFIAAVVRKMRYRKRVRLEVREELTSHFEDELRDCTSDEEREQRARRLVEEFGDAGLIGVLCRRAKKRCRPLWAKALIRSAQALGVFVLYAFICSLPMTLGKPTIRVNYVEWLNDRWRPATTDAVNAKPLYDQAAKACVQAPQLLKDKVVRGGAFERSRVEWFSGYSDEEKEALKRWLDENKPALDTLRKASHAAEYWPAYNANVGNLIDPVVADSMQVLSGYRQFILALREQIAWEASEGRIEEALDDCFVLRRFGRHLQGKGLLNDQLNGVASESICYDGIALILHRVNVSAPLLVRVQQELERNLNPDRQVVNLDCEKAFWYDNIQRRFTDDGRGGGHVLKQGIPFAAGDWRRNLIGILGFQYPGRREAVAMVEDYFQEAQRQFVVPPSQWEAEAARRECNPPRARSLLLDVAAPAYDRMSQQAWRIKMHELATIVLVAIKRYDIDTGACPDSLDQLVEQDYLKKLPDDPYGHGPLTYRRTGGGFLLYSWGPNLEDDGGRWGTDSRGEPNRRAENGDWVFWPIDRE